MRTGKFILFNRTVSPARAIARGKRLGNARSVNNLVKRLDAEARLKRGDQTNVLPLVGTQYGLSLKNYLVQRIGLGVLVANALGVSSQQVYEWSNGNVPIPAYIAIELERITQGQVKERRR